MKCPVCQSRYDVSRRFCPSDGASLVSELESDWRQVGQEESYEPVTFEKFAAPEFPEASNERPIVTFGASGGQGHGDGWTPPPAPVASWQQGGLGPSTPFQPPVAEGANKTLAGWSLFLGILGLACCGIFASVPAIILGSTANGNIRREPNVYGGGGMAKAGVILGVIGTILSIILGLRQLAVILSDGGDF